MTRVRVSVRVIAGAAVGAAIGCAQGTIQNMARGRDGPVAGGSDSVAPPARPPSLGNDPAQPCGSQSLELVPTPPPEVFLVLDRSGSMTSPTSAGPTRWDLVTSAAEQVVAMTERRIQWGLELFPSDRSCGVAGTTVFLALMRGGAIAQALTDRPPDPDGYGLTPTRQAIYQAGDALLALADQNPKFLVLATDGEPNCAPDGVCDCTPGWTPLASGCCQGDVCAPCGDVTGSLQAVSDMASLGVATFVVGIATRGTDADQVLSQMAWRGGRARPEPVPYYAASDGVELASALGAIAGAIASCELAFAHPPARPDQVSLALDGRPVPRDPAHQEGWDFGMQPGSVRLFGSFCDALSHGAHWLQATDGCPPVQ